MDLGKLVSDDLTAEVPFEDALVNIKFIPRNKMLEIVNGATTISYNKRHIKEESIDSDKSNQLLGEAAVVGWSGFTQDGEDFPFTPENRDLLMLKWGDFCAFVNRVCTNLQFLMDAAREEAKKKS